MKRIGGIFCCLSMVLICSCGGGGSGSSDTAQTYSVTASVAIPTNASIAAPIQASSEKALSAQKASDAAGVGVVVQCQDTAGNNIGSPCTTGADGTCPISLTSDQLQAGVVFVSENMHSFQEYDSTEIATADAGTALTAPINAEEDVLYALVAHNCGGSLSACPPTIDTDCLHDAVAVLPGDDTPGTDTIDGYMEGLLEAQRNALINNPQGATNGLLAALGGNATAYIADVGSSEVSSANVPVADAVANSQVGAGSVNSAYCTRDDASAQSPWATARAGAATTDTTTFSMAMAGMFEFFAPAELREGVYDRASFRAFMSAGPQLDGFFGAAGGAGNDLARNAFVQGFRNGMFADPANAPVAVGFVGSTFPQPVNGVYGWTGIAYDPQTAVLAGRNAFVEMTSQGSYNPTSFNPNAIQAAFQSALTDPDRRSTFASGGCSDFVGAFMGNPTGFVPADNFARILAPPGAGCTTSSGCMPCDTCTSNRCVAGSSKMGVSCSSDSDCDAITICTGPPNSAFATYASRNCMCASAVPTGMGVFTGGSTGPQPYGMTGGYVPPAGGTQGGTCGPGTSCGASLTCTDPTHSGICQPDTYLRPAGSPCSTASQCISNTCTSSICTPAAGGCGTRTNGTACAFPSECQSCNCMGGVCTAMGGGGTPLKPDGVACAVSSECASGNCNPSMVCGPMGGGGAPGTWCNTNDMCLSHICNFGMMQCS